MKQKKQTKSTLKVNQILKDVSLDDSDITDTEGTMDPTNPGRSRRLKVSRSKYFWFWKMLIQLLLLVWLWPCCNVVFASQTPQCSWYFVINVSFFIAYCLSCLCCEINYVQQRNILDIFVLIILLDHMFNTNTLQWPFTQRPGPFCLLQRCLKRRLNISLDTIY